MINSTPTTIISLKRDVDIPRVPKLGALIERLASLVPLLTFNVLNHIAE